MFFTQPSRVSRSPSADLTIFGQPQDHFSAAFVAEKWWAGEGSNLRRAVSPAALQAAPIGHSGTCPRLTDFLTTLLNQLQQSHITVRNMHKSRRHLSTTEIRRQIPYIGLDKLLHRNVCQLRPKSHKWRNVL